MYEMSITYFVFRTVFWKVYVFLDYDLYESAASLVGHQVVRSASLVLFITRSSRERLTAVKRSEGKLASLSSQKRDLRAVQVSFNIDAPS